MVSFIVFHVLMFLFGLGILTKVVPQKPISSALDYVHKTIGITTPSVELTRVIALVWIGSTVIIVDACLLLLLFITSLTNSR